MSPHDFYDSVLHTQFLGPNKKLIPPTFRYAQYMYSTYSKVQQLTRFQEGRNRVLSLIHKNDKPGRLESLNNQVCKFRK